MSIHRACPNMSNPLVFNVRWPRNLEFSLERIRVWVNYLIHFLQVRVGSAMRFILYDLFNLG